MALPSGVQDLLPGSFNMTEKARATTVAIGALEPGQLLTYGEVSALAGLPGAALNTSRVRHNLYEVPGMEFVLPLHRVMSTKDELARVDGATGLGSLGRVFKCALREAEGCYSGATAKKLPSTHGLPKGKPHKLPKAKKRKRDDEGTDEGQDDGGLAGGEAPQPPPPSPAVDAAECERMLAKIRAFVESDPSLSMGDAYKRGRDIVAS